MTLLIAEDNDINQQLITLYMSKIGWDYVMVEDGLEAVEVFSDGHFDAVLMDIDMPYLNGIEAARKIRKKNKTIPIIAITAYADEEMRSDCTNAGLNAFLTKPCTREEIMSIIKECVGISILKPAAI